MGLDYIRKETGRPWTKRWDGGLDRLKIPSLFEMQISEDLRRLTARVVPNVVVEPGKDYLAERDSDGIKLCDGLRQVARVDHPPEETLAQIEACGGYAVAKVIRVGLFGDTVEVEVR
jgi:hypothetical protein